MEKGVGKVFYSSSSSRASDTDRIQIWVLFSAILRDQYTRLHFYDRAAAAALLATLVYISFPILFVSWIFNKVFWVLF